ncbi:hypothetical protein [Clostridium baratii]|uniref:MurR/RpiR family transcriptional regulator n=1 Tax=Clostridium baratii TaxID=1561 RepID=UPI00290324AD|nr:hypothetical protein [Clostridium baratii]MDU1054410.1 hypothetical protein [Clostridium baratii]
MLMNKVNDILNTTYTNDTYHSICKYIKDNIMEIPNMSIDEMADGCFVSKSMISKFTKKLGYETFKDFKYDCEIHCDLIKKMPITQYQSNKLRENVIETMDSITNALRNAINKIDYDVLENLIEDIDKCSCVVAMGHGASKNICESLQFYFDYIKKPVMIADTDFTREELVEDNAIILIISANGNILKYDNRLINRINSLKQKKWLITCNSEVKKIENIVLVPSKEAYINDMLTMFMVKVIASRLKHKKSKVHKS